MGPKKKTVTVTEALERNLAPLLEMKVNQDGIPTALEPEDILSFLHEMEQYNAQRTDVMERALILLCMSGDVRDYLAQYESLLTINHTENDEVQEWELLSYDRWDPNKKTERQKCLDWDETIADALRKEFGLVRHGNESFKEALERKLMKTFEPTGNGPKHDFSVLAVQVAAVVKSAMQKSMEELTEEEQKHVSKCLREMFVNHPLMRAKLKNLPKDSFPEHPGKLLMKLGEMGKQFWDGSALSGGVYIYVSGGGTVDTSNLSPESRGMVENVARSLARK